MKYKVLLADDEPSITESMKVNIPWEKYDMEVLYTTTSGMEAKDILLNKDVDIAILDIRMPGYSGLELSKICFTNDLKTKIIIVSGYAEFSYAQKAISYDVVGYLLKPVEYEELEVQLLKAQRALSDSGIKDSSSDFMSAIEENNIEKMRAYLIDQGFDSYTYYIASIYGDCPGTIPGALALPVGTNQSIYISTRDYAKNCFADVTGSVGLYPYAVDLLSLRKAIYECMAMCYSHFMTGGISDEYSINTTYIDFHKTRLYNAINSAINFNEKDKLIMLLNKLREPEYRNELNINSAMKLNNMLVSNAQLFVNSQDYYIYNYKQLTHDYVSFDNLLDNLIQLLDNASSDSEEDNAFNNTYFLKIMKYINTYYNENITLKDVAAVVNLNPNYVSQIFKKNAGTTFSHYLINLRITNAKKMISTTNTSINEIAAETGFNDYFYFLKTFKKMTGKTPSEYREECAS